ncbi:molybdopterin-dependent oxidoreductase, partial [Pseudomonas aeruginosa]|uniref:molybdopterin-dependent oxidoreductase n=1 Tax=Pseudomonas aeruginosa TaxID=287 RepID=UPI0031B6C482
QAIMPYVVGGSEVYQQQTSWPLVLEHSDVVVLWSANPLNTLKIAWNASDEQWRKHSKTISRELRNLVNSAPPGQVMKSIVAEQVKYIKSLPLEAADRV